MCNMISYSQTYNDELEIQLCNELSEINDNNLFELKLIIGLDTFLFPKIGENKYLNPLKFFNVDSKNESVFVVYENTEYTYQLSFLIEDLKYSHIDLCIENKVFNKNQVKWSYTNYYGKNLAGITERIKK